MSDIMTLTDTWRIVARQITCPDQCSAYWEYDIGDWRTIKSARAAGRILTALRREPDGGLVMVGKMAPPKPDVVLGGPMRRGNCVRA